MAEPVIFSARGSGRIRETAGLASIEDAIRGAPGDELYFQRIEDGWSVVLRGSGEYLEVDLRK